VPAPLKAQLRVGGRLLMPLDIGGHGTQRLLKVVRHAQDDFEQQTLGSVAFVPLIGQYGWAEGDARAGAHATRP
jgi:protein-L-isoaspartate O-methyltransferase